MNILVAGATGFVGSHLVPALLDRGHRVRCLSRNPARSADSLPASAEVVYGDVYDLPSLRAATDGMEVAYYLVHSMEGSEFEFEERDRSAARNFATAAADARLSRIIFLGGLGDEASQLSAHLRSRHEVGAILRAGSVPVTELRAGLIIGAGSASYTMLRQLVERLPVMITPRWVDTPTQPIAIDDIVRYLVAVLDDAATEKPIYEVGGPDVMTYRSMMQRYARARGMRRWMISVPVLTPRLSSYWVDVITDVDAALARPLIEGLRSEMLVRDDAVVQAFGPASIDYEEALERAGREEVSASEAPLFWLRRLPGHLFDFARRRLLPSVFTETQVRRSTASREALWASAVAIGGREGYPMLDFLWRLRGAVDRRVGGPGLGRSGEPAGALHAGDRVDFWQVLEHDPGERLRMRALMKVPGKAELEFHVEEQPGRTVLVQTARFMPRGLLGRVYWWTLYPLHALIFHGMSSRIVARAESGRGASGAPPAGEERRLQ
jgi:uncharacterized protein YbjT (DUF2867 family)